MFLFVYYCNIYIYLNHLRFKRLGGLSRIVRDEGFLIKRFEWEERRS